MRSVPNQRRVELRLRDTVALEGHRIVDIRRFVMPVLQSRQLQHCVGLMQIYQHLPHLP